MIRRYVIFSSLLYATLAGADPASLPIQPRTPTPAESREKWHTATRGTNLALGKEVTFSRFPNYRLTADDHDPLDLTTGKLSQRDNDQIWFSRDAVGWTTADQEVTLTLDLGHSEPIGRVAIRFLGGKHQPILPFPSQIRLALSEDGKQFFEAANLRKVNEGESELADQHPDRYFFREESGVAHTDTFTFEVQRRARYVAITASSASGFLFTDQLAVIRAEGSCAGLEGLPPTRLLTRGLAIAPKGDELVLTTNIPTPQYFQIADARSVIPRMERRRFLFDLPAGMSVIGPEGLEIRCESEAAAHPTRRWIVEETADARPSRRSFGPFFFRMEEGAELGEHVTATFAVDEEESASNATTVPVRSIAIPTVEVPQGLEVSLGWFNEKDQYLYPDFLKNFRKLGFNIISTFPRTQSDPVARKQQAAFVGKAREEGYRVLYNESAFHEMLKRWGTHEELYNRIGDRKGRYPCPTYTGTYYRKEIERIRQHAHDLRPDFVFFDIELWHNAVEESKRCTRCQEAWQASGVKDRDRFLEDQGTRMMRDLHQALTGTAPDESTPSAGLYNVQPDGRAYHSIYRFSSIYPQYVQFAQPSLYVQGDAQRVHDAVAASYAALGSRQIVPWLTAGTYGEFAPEKLEQMIYEAFLNGSRGITYYAFSDFEPMDFYYHAQAIRTLAPYAPLLTAGKALPATAGNQRLTVSAFGTDEAALLLIGNYHSAQMLKATVAFPERHIVEALDLKSGRAPESLTELEVAAGKQRLLWVKLSRTAPPEP